VTAYLLDVNLMVALFDPRHAFHPVARAWFAGIGEFATTPLTESALVRLVANPHVSGQTTAVALGALAAIRRLPGHRFVADDSSLGDPLIDLDHLSGYRQVTDFQLVNLAARHGLVLATLDNGIAQALAPLDRRHVEVVTA
jgi:toxin-antitoxin system PIN domain toxin